MGRAHNLRASNGFLFRSQGLEGISAHRTQEDAEVGLPPPVDRSTSPSIIDADTTDNLAAINFLLEACDSAGVKKNDGVTHAYETIRGAKYACEQMGGRLRLKMPNEDKVEFSPRNLVNYRKKLNGTFYRKAGAEK